MVATADDPDARVLAAIDGGGLSPGVLRTAKAVAPLFHAEVRAVHVFETADETVLARRCARDAGVRLQIFEGPVLSTLATACGESAVAAIVIGASQGRGEVRALGRRALGLITATQRPVVVLPDGAEPPEHLRRALLPLDASPLTREALADAAALAQANGVDLMAMHVHAFHDVPMFSDQPQHEVPAWSAEFLRRYWPASGPHPHLRLRVGVPADEILTALTETHADLLVLGWSQDFSSDRADVVRTALLRSRRPVLLLPVTTDEAVQAPELRGVVRRRARAAVSARGR